MLRMISSIARKRPTKALCPLLSIESHFGKMTSAPRIGTMRVAGEDSLSTSHAGLGWPDTAILGESRPWHARHVKPIAPSCAQVNPGCSLKFRLTHDRSWEELLQTLGMPISPAIRRARPDKQRWRHSQFRICKLQIRHGSRRFESHRV